MLIRGPAPPSTRPASTDPPRSTVLIACPPRFAPLSFAPLSNNLTTSYRTRDSSPVSRRVAVESSLGATTRPLCPALRQHVGNAHGGQDGESKHRGSDDPDEHGAS
jgi:hypothetical protein